MQAAPPRSGWRHRRLSARLLDIGRNLARRKLRNALTLGGIMIGVLALTTLGGMSEKANAQLDGGARLLGDHVIVQAANSAGSGLIKADTVTAMRKTPGAGSVYLSVSMPAEQSPSLLGGGSSIIGLQDGERQQMSSRLPIARGRQLRSDDRGAVVVGSDVARRERLTVGGHVTLPIPTDGAHGKAADSRDFRVVGIMSRTLAPPDQWVLARLPDAQQLLKATLPPEVANAVPLSQIANAVDVYGKPGTDLEALARRLQQQGPGLQAISPQQAVEAFQSVGATYTALTTGSALVALIVGGLAVTNTMIMAVSERFREIGIKKAVGAPLDRILIDLLIESVVLGFLGGVLGFGLGWAVTAVVNQITSSSQAADLFLLTPRLALLALGFSVGLGALAGVLPALRAARLDPVAALRSQA